MSYTKLSHSILTSTLWMEDADTRLVWVTMLAMKNRFGEVQGSIPGLANVARVPVEACRAAITKFLSPDPDSRTTDHEGRRIEVIPGGWVVLNHDLYADLDSIEDRKRKDAIRQQRLRDRRKALVTRDGVTNTAWGQHVDVDVNKDEEGEGEGENALAPIDDFEQERKWLEGLGAITRRGGVCIITEWKAVTRRLKVAHVEQLFKDSNGIQWPSEFKKHREARGI